MWPTPADLARQEPSRVADILYGVSDYEKKAQNIVALSEVWCAGDFNDLRDLPGVTMRVASDLIRCLDSFNVPSDHSGSTSPT